MGDIFFLVLRRMRPPLILLIIVYSIATIGMTLIPGVTPDGEPWRMDFFHAFYFVSFMGTTIGFGEIPYEFTDMQRSWVLVCIYTSVVAWLYGIGSVLGLVQDETFLHAVAKRNFNKSIRQIDIPFYIICGYGETGEMINRGLCSMGMQTVIIDWNAERVASLRLGGFRVTPIALTADITDAQNLVSAGINHELCRGVIAVTDNDHINLQVAVASKLVNPGIRVIARSELEDEAKNMASFGTDVIINPYHTFAHRLKQLASKPKLYQLQNWFINQYRAEQLSHSIEENGLPTKNWIICGYGRLGKSIHAEVGDIVDNITVIDVDPLASKAPDGTIVGRGTEADTLEQASIMQADVIIAASNDDANNLSIIMTAKQLNPNIITIGRVSKESNKTLFTHAKCHYIMRRSLVVANEALTTISRPLVTRFVKFSSSLTREEISMLTRRIDHVCGDKEPVTWRLILDQEQSGELVNFIEAGGKMSIREICHHRRVPSGTSIPLLLLREGVSYVVPDQETELEVGDELLICGPRGNILLPQRLQHNVELLDSILNSNTRYIPFLRWLERHRNEVH